MQVEYSNKIFLPCIAHQMNLIVREILSVYQQTSTKAVKIVS